MIARLRGRVDTIEADHLVLDVHGVGYLVHCPSRTLANLPALGEPADLLIETQVREESITLYGFSGATERAWFRLLQTVQGVGARVALAILSVLPPEDLAHAIAAQDKAALARASGVGTRLAGRIVAELQNRPLELPAALQPIAAATPAASTGIAADALSALVNLGYGRSEAHAALSKAQADLGGAATVDALIRTSLRQLSAR